jgi:hypothetical protein
MRLPRPALEKARPRGARALLAVVLAALLFSQWAGWTHRIEHAPGLAYAALAPGAAGHSTPEGLSRADAAREHHHEHHHEQDGEHEHGEDHGHAPSTEGAHSCVLLDAAALGDGPPAQASLALGATSPHAALASAPLAVRALDCPAFASARAPPSRFS